MQLPVFLVTSIGISAEAREKYIRSVGWALPTKTRILWAMPTQRIFQKSNRNPLEGK